MTDSSTKRALRGHPGVTTFSGHPDVAASQSKAPRVGEANLEGASEDRLQGEAKAQHFTRRSFADSIRMQIEEQSMAKKQRLNESEPLQIKKGIKRRSQGFEEEDVGHKKHPPSSVLKATERMTTSCIEAEAISRLLNVDTKQHYKRNERMDQSHSS